MPIAGSAIGALAISPERKKRNQKSEYEQQKLPHVMLFSQPQSPEAVSVSTGSAGKR